MHSTFRSARQMPYFTIKKYLAEDRLGLQISIGETTESKSTCFGLSSHSVLGFCTLGPDGGQCRPVGEDVSGVHDVMMSLSTLRGFCCCSIGRSHDRDI